MERVPRFDTKGDDPTSVKSDLSHFANDVLHQLLDNSELKDKIIIGKHNIECSPDAREYIYGRGTNFDGIHLCGPSGQKAFTSSIANILTNIATQPSSSSGGLAYSQRRAR